MADVKAVRKALNGVEFTTAKTRKGTDYRIYNITECEEFWEMWNDDKNGLKKAGFVVYRNGEEWFLRDFSELDYDCSKKASKARSVANLEKAREVRAANIKKNKKTAKKVATPKGNEADELKKAIAILKKYGLM